MKSGRVLPRCALLLFLPALVLVGCSNFIFGEKNRPPFMPPESYYGVRFVDAQSGRGIPLVHMETMHSIHYVSDSAGWVAIDPSDLALQVVYYRVRSDGYRLLDQGKEVDGIRLFVESGSKKTIELHRTNIAERLYRVTGEGIYHDSRLLGTAPDLPVGPAAPGGVFGQDSVVNAILDDQLLWFWGDTLRGDRALGNFSASGAVSGPPDATDPDTGVALDYFTGDDGFTRAMCPLPAPGAVWLDGLMSFEENGEEVLYTHYARMKSLEEPVERGLARWDPAKGVFEKLQELPVDAPLRPVGHPIKRELDGQTWFYFGRVIPNMRVRATSASITDLSAYEGYSCLQPGKSSDARPVLLERNAQGDLVCDWKPATQPLAAQDWSRLIAEGIVHADEYPWALNDSQTGELVEPIQGAVAWNEYSDRWILLFQQVGGEDSFLGEIWYADAPTPLGPWSNVTRVITHDRYTFYNVKQHPYFARGSYIYFEGTYTKSFSARIKGTPRYDYNQVMYRLNLSDPRLTGDS